MNEQGQAGGGRAKWSINANATTSAKNMQKMMSINSDDGDYDMDERGGVSTSKDSGSMNYGGNNQGVLGDGDNYGNEGGEGPLLCQPVGGDNFVRDNDDVAAAAEGGGNNNNQLPTYQEVDMEDEDNDNDEDGDGHEESDISSAEKYADRNSDPGIHVQQEADYPLPSNMPYHNSAPPLRGDGDGGGPFNEGGVGSGPHPYGAMDTTGGALGLPPNPLPYTGAGIGGVAGGTATGNESVSLGTATQTHEVRMPMTTTTFKPATGCTNASDFIVRCFVARLRSGITVVKHGRSRWCKSRLRVLHVHPDGRSLSWKPALGEPSSGKRPPKLDLTSCREVRHAWSPDPDNPMFTGTPILRQKCEAANAHKSFALIFPKRTVDITAVTADQCKVLMEGFSALCFRLQVAQNVAASSSGNNNAAGGEKKGEGGAVVGEDKAATASVTLTNNSLRQQDSPKRKGGKKRSFR